MVFSPIFTSSVKYSGSKKSQVAGFKDDSCDPRFAGFADDQALVHRAEEPRNEFGDR